MSRKLERMRPVWVPGTNCGYHALTIGFLIDQIVRRIDEKKRGITEFLREEILDKYGELTNLFKCSKHELYNKLENRLLPMPSNMGIASARAVAKIHSLIAEGKLLSKAFLSSIEQPQLVDQFDIVNGYPESKGFGWQYTKNKLVPLIGVIHVDENNTKLQGNWIFGHSGYGGQNVRVDVQSHLAFAYVCNGLKAGDADCVDTFTRLQDALYECLKNAN
ncbi:unnamed protein product [Anisakis simplex]|uniref:Beta-lactamase domain-containing protein n=1 Tax=Anisakis simplex TaxID=6269 RepID=A0A0M3KGC4_ANISI|nr:unnamed protein product [Anisakis simplex]